MEVTMRNWEEAILLELPDILWKKAKVGYHGYSDNGDEIDIIPSSSKKIWMGVTGNTGGFWSGYYNK